MRDFLGERYLAVRDLARPLSIPSIWPTPSGESAAIGAARRRWAIQ